MAWDTDEEYGCHSIRVVDADGQLDHKIAVDGEYQDVIKEG